MVSTWTSRAARRRRYSTGLVIALAACAALMMPVVAQAALSAQDAPAQTPPPPQARVFTADAGIMFNVIKADKAADFEMVIGKLKEALEKSENPVRKQQAAGWRVYKQAEPLPNGNALYVFLIDPVVKDADYTVSRILAEAFPAEVQDLFKVYSAAYAGGVNMANYQLVHNLGAK